MKTSLTINFEGNVGEGWTSQVAEYPAAVSQGDHLLEAAANVLLALREVMEAANERD